MKIEKISSNCDGLELEVAILEPLTKPIGIVVIAHGMTGKKENYYSFMEFLANHGYICIAHDHRGHGNSVKKKEDLGYFYTKNENYIVEDLHQVVGYAKILYPGLKLYLFGHSMGTLVGRCYLKKYDDEFEKVIFTGPPTYIKTIDKAIFVTNLLCIFQGSHKRSEYLQTVTFGKKKSQSEGNTVVNYVFTNNGFLNVYKLLKKSYLKIGWQVKNSELPMLILAGEKDPVVGKKEKFEELIAFLKEVGYQNITSKTYPNMYHELVNSKLKEPVLQDILEFLKK